MKDSETWRYKLHTDIVPVLLNAPDEAVRYFTRRDLLDEQVEPINYVWNLPVPLKIVRKQQSDGSWKFTGKQTSIYPEYHHTLVETFKQFRILVDRYEFNNNHYSIHKAAEYIFSCQTGEGDFRGMIGNQYATYYTGLFLYLLIRAGYADDPRVDEDMRWLLSMRQNDGGWTIPIITHKFDRQTMYRLTSQYAEPVEPDRTKPFSHNWTNMVLQAFAVHLEYRKSIEVKAAGDLLKSRFFQPDVYTSYKAASYWTRFLFWWPNLLTALNSLMLLGFPKDDPDIRRAIAWFTEHQANDGLWKLFYADDKENNNTGSNEERLWLSLAVSRLLKNYEKQK